jgi:hypothetical protein
MSKPTTKELIILLIQAASSLRHAPKSGSKMEIAAGEVRMASWRLEQALLEDATSVSLPETP